MKTTVVKAEVKKVDGSVWESMREVGRGTGARLTTIIATEISKFCWRFDPTPHVTQEWDNGGVYGITLRGDKYYLILIFMEVDE